MGRDAIKPGTVRYLKQDDYLWEARDSGRVALLVRGQGLKLTGLRDGNYVQVQPVDVGGRPSGRAGWVDANLLTKPPEVPPGGGLVYFKGRDYTVGPAGARLLAGDFPSYRTKKKSWCAGVVQEVYPGLPTCGEARKWVDILPKHGWRKLRAGEMPAPDDIFVRTTGGDGAGHAGLMGLQGRVPVELSWMTIDGTPRIDARPIRPGTRVFTRRR